VRPRIGSLDDRTRIEILDPIENHRYGLDTPEPVAPTPVGSVQELHLRGPDDPDFHLVPGPAEPFAIRNGEFGEAVGSYSVPLVADDELLWSDQPFGDSAE
jgi:hypothetical protein